MTDLALLELERKKINAKLTRMRILIASISLFAGGVLYNLTSDISQSVLVCVVCFFGLLGFFKNMLTEDFTKKFKQQVIQKIVENLGLNYSRTEFVHMGHFEVLYDTSDIDKYTGNDLIFGHVDGVNIKFSDVRASKIIETKNGKRQSVQFLGVVFVADFHKKLSSVTQIRHKDFSTKFKRYGHKAHMDDVEFEEIFDVYTTDQIGARYALTPYLMQQFKYLERRFNCPMNVVLIADKIYMAIDMDKDSFEPDMSQMLVGKSKAIAGYENEIKSFISIVRDLNLNRKIWMS